MATRKDLLKAQSFTTQRLVAALVDRNPDEVLSPLKRSVTAVFVSLMAGVVVLAGIMLWAKMHPGTSSTWREEGTIIEDTTSGTLFAYQASDQSLTPLADITSARLWVSGADATNAPKLITVKGPSLSGVPHNEMRGIANAPRQLPTPDQLQTYPIKVCATPSTSDGQRFVTLQFEAAAPVNGTESGVAVGVRDSSGTQYIVVDGVAHRLPSTVGGRRSPLLAGYPLIVGAETWLKALPTGSPIAPIDVPNAQSTPRNPGDPSMSVGQVAIVNTPDGPEYYLQYVEGLRRISYLEALLIKVNSKTDPVQITAAAASSALDVGHENGGADDIPRNKPQAPSSNLDMSGRSLCATWDGSRDNPVLTVGDDTPAMPRGVTKPRGAVADVIQMTPLHGALLQNSSNLDGPATPAYLIVNSKSYAIPDQASRFALGYPAKTPLSRVPGGLITLIPPGLPQGVNLSKGFVLPT